MRFSTATLFLLFATLAPVAIAQVTPPDPAPPRSPDSIAVAHTATATDLSPPARTRIEPKRERNQNE